MYIDEDNILQKVMNTKRISLKHFSMLKVYSVNYSDMNCVTLHYCNYRAIIKTYRNDSLLHLNSIFSWTSCLTPCFCRLYWLHLHFIMRAWQIAFWSSNSENLCFINNSENFAFTCNKTAIDENSGNSY